MIDNMRSLLNVVEDHQSHQSERIALELTRPIVEEMESGERFLAVARMAGCDYVERRRRKERRKEMKTGVLILVEVRKTCSHGGSVSM